MRRMFKVGDQVAWNSEAGRVRATVIRVHSKDIDYKGYTTTRRQKIRNMKSKAVNLAQIVRAALCSSIIQRELDQ
jgi:hypothetical protein